MVMKVNPLGYALWELNCLAIVNKLGDLHIRGFMN